jgi:hypothetical protein
MKQAYLTLIFLPFILAQNSDTINEPVDQIVIAIPKTKEFQKSSPGSPNDHELIMSLVDKVEKLDNRIQHNDPLDNFDKEQQHHIMNLKLMESRNRADNEKLKGEIVDIKRRYRQLEEQHMHHHSCEEKQRHHLMNLGIMEQRNSDNKERLNREIAKVRLQLELIEGEL